MNKQKAYEVGYEAGRSICLCLILEFPKGTFPTDKDEFIAGVVEHEQNDYRDRSALFQLFEVELKESNKMYDNGERLWQSYNDGVLQGTKDAYQEFVEDMEV